MEKHNRNVVEMARRLALRSQQVHNAEANDGDARHMDTEWANCELTPCALDREFIKTACTVD